MIGSKEKTINEKIFNKNYILKIIINILEILLKLSLLQFKKQL